MNYEDRVTIQKYLGVSESSWCVLKKQLAKTNRCVDHFGQKGIYITDISANSNSVVPVSKDAFIREMMSQMITTLYQYSEAYYNGEELVPNIVYDTLYDELDQIEKETGIILSNSPTQKVGIDAVDKLEKTTHEYPALSLDKTKDISLFEKKFREGVVNASQSKLICIMWKMDGGTVVATYDNGKLSMLATRGNGVVGSDITHNAKYIDGLPQTIAYDGHLVVRGEAVMSYSEFNRINSGLSPEDQYKNPRNLANATISLLDSNDVQARKICFKCFDLVNAKQVMTHSQTSEDRFAFLEDLGFSCVDREYVTVNKLAERMEAWELNVTDYDFPVDGLVCCMDDLEYADSLPGTGHNPNIMRGYAFKWADETAETVLRKIEWSASRTGLLNPVAVFDPVELEGTTVSRASLHNVSYIEQMNLQVGDVISVYKSNKIIPQVAKNLSNHDQIMINTVQCPCCGAESVLMESKGGVLTMICNTSSCPAKRIGAFVHMAERDCLNIVGLSEEKIADLVNHGFIHDMADIFRLPELNRTCGILNGSAERLEDLPGWGSKSVSCLVNAIEQAKNTDFVSFIHAMGIPGVGKGQAKLLKQHLESLYGKVDITIPLSDGPCDLIGLLASLVLDNYDFKQVNGFGTSIAGSLSAWMNTWIVNPVQLHLDKTLPDCEVVNVLKYLRFHDEIKVSVDSPLSGKIFVITGELTSFKNRDELIAEIESYGGKVSGSVSKNTSYLINNDVNSTSGKNKKAKELGIPIISEEEYVKLKNN